MTDDSKPTPKNSTPCLDAHETLAGLLHETPQPFHHVETDKTSTMTHLVDSAVSPGPRRCTLSLHATQSGPTTACSPYFRWKGLPDRLLAALMLIPILPLIGLLAALVRCTSQGPGIFRQRRVGKDGRCFEMFKLRSMRYDAETGTGAVWSQPGDPRVTFLGRILRKLHLDELPQLFNVLRGEMSLVGPRPERPEFVFLLAKQIPGYGDRFNVLPGVTGLAQVNLPPDSDIESVRKKLLLDLDYVHRGNLWLDLRIIVCTACRAVGIPLRRVLGLRRRVRLSDNK